MSDPILVMTFQDGETDRGLEIELHDPEGRAKHERVQGIFAAADEWSEQTGISIRTNLVEDSALPHSRQKLAHYLYADGMLNPARIKRHLSMIASNGRIHFFTPRPGGLIEGPDLVGRQPKLDELSGLLSSGDSCHLRAPRRYGKSSVLNRLAHDLRSKGTPCLLTDISSGRSAVWLMVKLAVAAMETPECRKSLESIPELAHGPLQSRELASAVRPNVWRFGRDLLAAIARSKAVLILDEFSVFLRAAVEDAKDEAETICDIFAEARAADPPLRQILCGSAGLSAYIAYRNLSEQFANLKAVDLEPLSKDDGQILIEELMYASHLIPAPESIAAIADTIGAPVPYFIHVLADEVRKEIIESGERLNRTLVDRAYCNRVMGAAGNFWFKCYQLGNQPYPKEIIAAAEGVLDRIAKKPEGRTHAELRTVFLKQAPGCAAEGFDLLMSCLQEDYDLIRTDNDDRWLMRSKVLRDRWALSEAWLTGGI